MSYLLLWFHLSQLVHGKFTLIVTHGRSFLSLFFSELVRIQYLFILSLSLRHPKALWFSLCSLPLLLFLGINNIFRNVQLLACNDWLVVGLDGTRFIFGIYHASFVVGFRGINCIGFSRYFL